MKIFAPRQSMYVLSILLLMVSLSSTATYAQILAVSGNHGEMAQQLAEAMEWRQENLATRFRIKLAELDTVCELSRTQKKQLEIAIKGTVTTCMNIANKKIIKAASEQGLSFDPENPEEWEAAGDPVGAMMPPAFYFGEEDHKFWNNALERTLTEEQAEQWKAWQAHRNDVQKQLAIGRFLIVVDQQLRLSDQQRDEFEKVVSEQYGELFIKNLDKKPQGTIDFSKRSAIDKQDRSYQMVADILTEDQLQIWGSILVPVLRSLR